MFLMYMAQMLKNLPAMQKTRVLFLGQKDTLEEGMATHSSILAWRIPWTEEPGGVQFMESQRAGHGWVTNTFIFITDLQYCVNFCSTAKLVIHMCVCIHTHTHTYIYIYIYILFHIIFYYGLSQDIEYSSLYYTGRPCCLSILYIIVCIW